MTIGFVSCAEIGGITPDDALAAAALTSAGVAVHAVPWDTGEPETCDALLLRSPWNYHLHHEAFLGWVDRASRATFVYNDPQLVRWNAHKGYLLQLQSAGIPIAETKLCNRGERADLRAIMAAHDWNQVVVKPAISASSFMTGIVGLPQAAHRDRALQDRFVEDGQHLLESILSTRDALVQPFMPEIFTRGERCLIFIDGAFSHAVAKAPFTNVGGGGETVTAEPIEIEIGERALSVLPQTPLYARIDLLRGNDGADRLMELELIDPELYLRFDSKAPSRLAEALLRRL